MDSYDMDSYDDSEDEELEAVGVAKRDSRQRSRGRDRKLLS